jgi:hypothetical protein
VSILGADQLDFNRADDQCIGSAGAAGASCTITIVFNPTATGTRTATLTVLDNNLAGTQTRSVGDPWRRADRTDHTQQRRRGDGVLNLAISTLRKGDGCLHPAADRHLA